MSKSKEWKKVEDGSLIQWDEMKVGYSFEGKLTSIQTMKSKEKGKKPYKVFKIETKKGLVACSGTNLESKLEGVKIGQEVKIVFKGKKKTKKYKMNSFDVFTK